MLLGFIKIFNMSSNVTTLCDFLILQNHFFIVLVLKFYFYSQRMRTRFLFISKLGALSWNRWGISNELSFATSRSTDTIRSEQRRISGVRNYFWGLKHICLTSSSFESPFFSDSKYLCFNAFKSWVQFSSQIKFSWKMQNPCIKNKREIALPYLIIFYTIFY